jgi:hypothetical protein
MRPENALLSVLFYDDRYKESRDRGELAIYRSLDRDQVPFVVGPPNEAFRGGGVKAGTGKPGDAPAERSALKYRPGDKVDWLMHMLPRVSSQFVFLLDTDTIWLCSAAEAVRKRNRLLREGGLRNDSVLLFGERGMWPPHQHFRGIHLRLNDTLGYPPAEKSLPFRYLNAGAAFGRPRDVMAMYECMRERYSGFPHACPAGHGADGGLRYYSAQDSWRPPMLTRKLHSHDLKYHGLRLQGSNWGWEQGCFHMYYLEHLNGELPARCPPMVLDRVGRFLINLAGVHQHRLAWSASNGSQGALPRVTFKDTDQKPCVLHANGPAKKALQPIWRWWNGTGAVPAWQ